LDHSHFSISLILRTFTSIMRNIFILAIWFFAVLSFGQDSGSLQQGIYKDRITDESGNPIAGIKVQVQGKSTFTFSDPDGNFSIKAEIGDLIVLTKNGERINAYRLDGRANYYINDESEVKGSTPSTEKYLDSARLYAKKDAYKSIDFVEKHLKSKKKHSAKELAQSYALLGDNYLHLKQYDLAISNYYKSLQSVENTEVQLNLGKSYSLSGNISESNNIYKTVLNKKNTVVQQIAAQEGLGYNSENNIPKALEYYRAALSLAEKNKITSKIAELNAKIAELLAKSGNKSESNAYLQNTLRSSENEPIQQRISVQNQVADVYQTNKDFDSEIEIRKKTIAELEKANVNKINVPNNGYMSSDDISISQLNLEIGRAYIDKKEFDKAIPYLEKSASNAKKFKDLEVEKNALQKLSELYKNIGNSKKALENYQEYAKLVDLLYQQKELEITSALALSNELRDKQNRINSLEKDRVLSESQYQLFESEQKLAVANYRRQKMLILGMGIVLVLLGISVLAMYRSNKQKKLANNVLALKSLRSQMNQHFIFNALNSVNNFIAQNDERAANRYLTDFSTLMRSVLNNSEEDFIPLSKEIELLKLYVQLEHSRFTDKFDYTLHIDENLNEEQFQIPPMLIQPYVENAVWHGLRYKETKGILKIEFIQKDADTILISISDDGIGRQKSKELKTQNQKKQESKGMNNVKKRIEILNEMYADKVKVNISDLHPDGSGTKVVVELKK
jgi:tetratricopeptide (TPR) repeat protein